MSIIQIVCPENQGITTVTSDYIERAIARREVEPTDHPQVFRIVPRGLNTLSEAKKRRIFLAKGSS